MTYQISESQRAWMAFRDIYGPRPMGRNAQVAWELEWEKFRKEYLADDQTRLPWV